MTVESKGVAELLADAAISNREIIEELGRYDAVRASFMKDVKECIKVRNPLQNYGMEIGGIGTNVSRNRKRQRIWKKWSAW